MLMLFDFFRIEADKTDLAPVLKHGLRSHLLLQVDNVEDIDAL